jgi:hypothetical protein
LAVAERLPKQPVLPRKASRARPRIHDLETRRMKAKIMKVVVLALMMMFVTSAVATRQKGLKSMR